MSKPTTPLSRNRIASSAISNDRAWWRIAVTRHRTVIARPSPLAAFSPSAKPASTASTTASSDKPAVDVQFGREPDLGVHHVVGGQVFDALVGHPVQRLRRLHHPDGVRERLQVALERSAVRGGAENVAKPSTSVAGRSS